MAQTSNVRLKDLLDRVTRMGGELAVQRGQFVKIFGEMSHVERTAFSIIDHAVTTIAVKLRAHLEEMDHAHYQEREQMEWRD